jgi:hypothetical protein
MPRTRELFLSDRSRHVGCGEKSVTRLAHLGHDMLQRLNQFVRGHERLLHWVSAGLFLAAFVLFVRSLPIGEILRWLRDGVNVESAWTPIGFVLLFIGLTVVLLPGWPLNVASGAIFGPLWGGVM